MEVRLEPPLSIYTAGISIDSHLIGGVDAQVGKSSRKSHLERVAAATAAQNADDPVALRQLAVSALSDVQGDMAAFRGDLNKRLSKLVAKQERSADVARARKLEEVREMLRQLDDVAGRVPLVTHGVAYLPRTIVRLNPGRYFKRQTAKALEDSDHYLSRCVEKGMWG